MTEPAAPSRSPRGRLLIVGDEPMPSRLTERLRHAPVRVQNLFEAIGELATGDPARPIVAALIPEVRLPALGSRAAEAIKRIDPSVRLILVVENPAGDRAPSSAGFDDCIEAPIDPEALDRLLGGGLLKSIDELQPDAATSPQKATAEERTEEPPAEDSASPVGPGEPAPLVEVERRPEPPPPRLPVPDAAAAKGMGDVDLLEAVMTEPEGVEKIALAMMRRRTGWNDLQLVPVDRIVDVQTPCTEVRDGERVYGKLISAAASTGQLAGWARWLARWLTHDASYRRYRLMAYRDELTCAWNRRYFSRFLDECITEAARRRRPVTVMVFDIDDFKRFNDEFGHESGDVILCETVALLNSVIRKCDRVCRIGGDEFAVIFADLEGPREAGSDHPESVEEIARRFQRQICEMRFPKLGLQAPGTLSISAGLATYPWDGNDPAALLRLADQRALESKNRGKNYITFGPAAAEHCPPPES